MIGVHFWYLLLAVLLCVNIVLILHKKRKSPSSPSLRGVCFFEEATGIGFMETIYQDGEYIITRFSGGAEKQSGYRESEVLGSSVRRCYTPEGYQKYLSHVEHMAQEKRSIVVDAVLLRKDGSEFVCLTHMYPVFNREGELVGVNGFAVDISDRKAAEETSQRQQKALQELNEELSRKMQEESERRIKNERMLFEQKKFADMGQMVSAIAHQWRQPLATLGLTVQEILEAQKHGELTDAYLRENVGEAMSLIQHMSRTIDDFRTFFRPEKGREEFCVATAVAEVIRLMDAQLRHHNIAVNLHLCSKDGCFHYEDSGEPLVLLNPPVHAVAVGYPGEFKQALINLVQNAKDAIAQRQEEGKIASGEISITVTTQSGRTEIVLTDNGGGIQEECLPNVFDPFFSTKPEKTGTGIGLYMTRQIIENSMKGSIAITNEREGVCVRLAV